MKQKCSAKIYQLCDPNTPPFDNWISNDDTDINKQYRSCTDSLPLKKTTHYHKNDHTLSQKDHTLSQKDHTLSQKDHTLSQK